MELTNELAEVLGMFAADGCLQEGYICMWGNIHEDKDYYNNIVCPFFSKVFGKNVVAHEKKSNSVYGFYLCDRKVVNLFRDFGFTNNKTYDVAIPSIILKSKDKSVWASFIRGFADCDGSFSLMKRKGKYGAFKLKFNTYPRVEMTSVSNQIISQISRLLDCLCVEHTVNTYKSKNENEMPSYKTVIRGPSKIKVFMDVIGFHNPSKIIKYKVWKKFGFCPPNSNIEDRKLFLIGTLNPYDFYKD